jgi:hypothetical protein
MTRTTLLGENQNRKGKENKKWYVLLLFSFYFRNIEKTLCDPSANKGLWLRLDRPLSRGK